MPLSTERPIFMKDIAEDLKGLSTTSKRGRLDVIETVFQTIADCLAAGRVVEISKFATFYVVDVAPRTGRNPATGESVEIPGKKQARIKYATATRRKINE